MLRTLRRLHSFGKDCKIPVEMESTKQFRDFRDSYHMLVSPMDAMDVCFGFWASYSMLYILCCDLQLDFQIQ